MSATGSLTAEMLMTGMGLKAPTVTTIGEEPMGINKVAIASRAGTFLALVADAISMAARLDPMYRKSPAAAEERLRGRMIVDPMKPGVPFISYVSWVATSEKTRAQTIFSDDDGEFVAPFEHFALNGGFLIPEHTRLNKKNEVVKVREKVIGVRPMIITNGMGGLIEYVGEDQSAVDEMLCIAFRPDGGGPPVALPLGLCRKWLVQRWNDIVKRAKEQGAGQGGFNEILAIPHALRSSTPTLDVRPTGGPYMGMYKNGNKLRKVVREGLERKPDYMIIGVLYGKVMRPHRKSRAPESVGDVFPICVWRLRETFNSIELTLIGTKGKVGKIGRKIQQVEALQIDPFGALGLRPQHTSPGSMISRRIAQLVEASYDAANPLFVAAVEQGVVDVDDPREQAETAMRELGLLCMHQAVKMLEDIIVQLKRKIDIAGYSDRPSFEEILEDVTSEGLKVAVKRRSAECPLSMWIASKVSESGQYDPENWVLSKIRRQMLMTMADEAGVSMPVKLKKNSPPSSDGGSEPKQQRASKQRVDPEATSIPPLADAGSEEVAPSAK